MTEVVLLGAAGHAKVIIEILQEKGDWAVVGCLSRDASGGSVLGVPILGDDSQLEGIFMRGVKHAFAAIGDNRIRSRICHRLCQSGFRLINAISHRAIISPSARIDSGIAIMPGAIVNAESHIAEGAIVNTGATIDHDCCIGSFSHVGPGSSLAGGIRLGEGAFLGIGSRVIPNIVIGEWAIIGAGSAVIANIPANVTAVGVPAKVLKMEGR